MNFKTIAMKKEHLLIVPATLLFCLTNAQIGINTPSPHSNAVLQLKPNLPLATAKTFILPQLPDQKNGGIIPASNTGNITPANQLDNGMMYYNTDSGCIDYWIAKQGKWGSLCATPPPSPQVTTITNDQNSYTYIFNSQAGTKNPPSINLLANIVAAGAMIVSTSDATQNTNGINYHYNGSVYSGNNQSISLVTNQGFPQTSGTFQYKAVYDSDGDGTPDALVTNQSGNTYTFSVKYQDVIPGQTKTTAASQLSPGFTIPSFVMPLNDLTIPVSPGQKLDAVYTINITNTDNAYAAGFAFPAITDVAAVPASLFTLSGTYTNLNSTGGTLATLALSTTNRDKNPVQGRGQDLTTSGLKQTINISVSYINNSASTVNFSIAATQDINFNNIAQKITVPSASVVYTTTTPGI